jgi:hypothetical protein
MSEDISYRFLKVRGVDLPATDAEDSASIHAKSNIGAMIARAGGLGIGSSVGARFALPECAAEMHRIRLPAI